MPQRDPLQTILDRVRVHAANEDWRKEGWKDEKIEAWLDALVADIAKTAGKPTLKTPMRLSETAPVTFRRYSANKPPIRFSDEQVSLVDERPTGFLICKNLKAGTLRNTIVLADGDVRCVSAQNSVIIARNWVDLAVANRSLIVAGTYAHVGISGYRDSPDDGNLIISRGWADVTLAFKTVLAAQEGVRMHEAEHSILVNSDASPLGAKNHTVRAVDLTLGRLPLDPISSKIEFVGVLQGRVKPFYSDAFYPTDHPSGLVFRFDGRQYVANADQPIVDETGKSVEALAGWKLKYISLGIAIFRNGDAEAVVRIGER